MWIIQIKQLNHTVVGMGFTLCIYVAVLLNEVSKPKL